MTLKPSKTLFLLISLLFFQHTNYLANAETITGTINSVIDGDTFTIISKGKIVEIRLFGIDTPEKTQAFGQAARNFTGGKAAKGEIRVEPITKDHDGRTVALVFVNGVNLNEQIVSQGFGWVYRQYCKKNYCADWLKLEADAKASHKGLWADANPTPPWEYRQKQLSSSGSKDIELPTVPSASVKVVTGGSVLPSTNVKIVPVGSVPSASVKNVTGGAAAYHGNTKKHVFHSSSCKEFNCPTCTVNFNSISEALDAGYSPHFECLTK